MATPLRLLGEALGAAPAGLASLKDKFIRAYHGSPHDFDRFDFSKIGTGEGAQAYGHGGYFAEVEKVAQNYRDQLRWRGADWDDMQTLAANAIDRAGSRSGAADTLQGALDSTNNFFRGKTMPASQASANAELQKAIDLLRGDAPITGKPPIPGHMYEVNIRARPDQLLDYDAPVSQQRHILDPLIDRFGGEGALLRKNRDLDDLSSQVLQDRSLQPAWDAMYRDPATRLGGLLADMNKPAVWTNPKDRTTGEALYRALSPDRVTASRVLQEAGVPGMRYLDQGSRASGVGTRNYVMFPGTENLIDVARKYAIPGAALASGLAFSSGDAEAGKLKAARSALDMSQEARMARAAEQGYDTSTPLYHGTSKDADFQKFKDSRHGTWTTSDPKEASGYAMQNDSQSYRMSTARGAKPWDMEPVNSASRVLPLYAKPLQNPAHFSSYPEHLQGATNYKRAQSEWFDELRRAGHDGIVMQGGPDGSKVRVDFNNANLRSAFAAFDPKNIGKSTITGALAAGVLPPAVAAFMMQRGDLSGDF